MNYRLRYLLILLIALSAALLWWGFAPQTFVMGSQEVTGPSVPATTDQEPALVGDGTHDRTEVVSESGRAVLRVLVRDNYQQPLGGIQVFLLKATDHSVVVAQGATDPETGEVSYALEVGRYDLYINTQGSKVGSYGRSVEAISVQQPTTISIERTLQRSDASLTVIVQDDHGEFVPGVEVSIMGIANPHRAARTDLQGTALLDRLVPGETLVEVHRGEATPFSVAVPENFRKLINLQSGMNAPCIFSVLRSGALDTRLECDDPRFGQSEEVSVDLLYDNDSPYSYPITPHRVTLGKTLRFDHVPPGTYQVRYYLTAGSLLSVQSDLDTVTVESGKTSTYVAHAVPAAGIVSGVVRYSGVPVEGVPIFVQGRTDGGSIIPLKSEQTDKEGRFEIRGLSMMPYLLYVEPSSVRGKQNFAYFGSFDKIHLDLGGPTTGLEIELQPGALLKGIVVDGRGKPVTEGEVVLNRARFESEEVSYLGNSNLAPGTFAFAHLRAGSYVLIYRRGKETLASRYVQLDGAVRPVVEIRWDIERKN